VKCAQVNLVAQRTAATCGPPKSWRHICVGLSSGAQDEERRTEHVMREKVPESQFDLDKSVGVRSGPGIPVAAATHVEGEGHRGACGARRRSPSFTMTGGNAGRHQSIVRRLMVRCLCSYECGESMGLSSRTSPCLPVFFSHPFSSICFNASSVSVNSLAGNTPISEDSIF
jgi:hypothetical protein